MRNRLALAIALAVVILDHVTLAGDLLPFTVYLAALVTLLGVCLVARAWATLHLCVYVVLFALSAFVPLGELGIARLLLVFAASLVVVVPWRPGRGLLGWMRRGHLDRITWIVVATTIVVAAGALILWAETTDDLGSGLVMARGLAQLPPHVVALAIPGFALLNALAEEVVYRGIFQEALTRVLPQHIWWVITLQSAAFAALHFAAGFPNGLLGYLMVLVWGAVLGFLRAHTRGLLAPYLVHVGADLVIATYLWSII